MGDEGPGRGTARDGMQHGRLNFDEALRLEAASQRGHDPRPAGEHGPGVVAHPQVHVAPAVAGVGVAETVPLVGERPLGPSQHRPLVDAHRQLAPAGGHDRPRHPDPVPDRQRRELFEGGGGRHGGEELYAPGGVGQGAEGQAALVAAQHEAAADRDHGLGLHAGFKVAEGLDDLTHSMASLEPVRDVFTHRSRLPSPQAGEQACRVESRVDCSGATNPPRRWPS